MPAAIAFAIQALSQLPALLQAGADVANVVSHTVTSLRAMHSEGREPTQAEWDTLQHHVEAGLGKLDAAAKA